MRVISLLPIVLLFSAPVFSADRDSLEQSTANVWLTEGLNSSSAGTNLTSRHDWNATDASDNVSWGRYKRLKDRPNSFCATMRTYIVAREERGSDATRVVGYARCLPAWRFQLRTAEQKLQDSSR